MLLCNLWLSLTLPNVICKRVIIRALIGSVMDYMSERSRRLRNLSLMHRHGKDIRLGHLMSMTEGKCMAMLGIHSIKVSVISQIKKQ